MDGLNAHCVIIDELHGVKDRNLYEVLKQSQSARRQPLLIMITTAERSAKTSLMKCMRRPAISSTAFSKMIRFFNPL